MHIAIICLHALEALGQFDIVHSPKSKICSYLVSKSVSKPMILQSFYHFYPCWLHLAILCMQVFCLCECIFLAVDRRWIRRKFS